MKIGYKVLMFLLVFFPLKSVYANSDISLDCPSGGKIGDVIECNITANSDIEISSLSIDLKLSDNLSYIKFKTDSEWQGDGNLGKIYLYTYPNKIGNFNIGTVSFKINGNNSSSNVSLENINFYKADFSKFSIGNISKNLRIFSDNNYLLSLSISDHDIYPEFNKNNLEYKVNVDNENITIAASAEDANAKINGLGQKKLDYGVNTFSVVVTSESGLNREYKIIVTRNKEEIKEEVKEENIPDNKVETVPENKPNNNQNKVESNIEIVKKDNNSKLKKIDIAGYKLNFQNNIYEYDLEILNKESKLSVDAVAESKNAFVAIRGNDNIIYGNNEIVITVTAEDGSKSIYKINAFKKINSCAISDIKILNYDFEFNCNKYDYELEIDYEDSLNIDVVPNNEMVSVDILNNSNLKHNDIINIVAKYEGIEYVYNIKILTNSFILGELFNDKQIIFIGIILIVLSSYLIVRSIINKKRKRNFKN